MKMAAYGELGQHNSPLLAGFEGFSPYFGGICRTSDGIVGQFKAFQGLSIETDDIFIVSDSMFSADDETQKIGGLIFGMNVVDLTDRGDGMNEGRREADDEIIFVQSRLHGNRIDLVNVEEKNREKDEKQNAVTRQLKDWMSGRLFLFA